MSWFRRPNPNSNTISLDDALKNSELKIMTNFIILTILFSFFSILTYDNIFVFDIFVFGAIISFSISIGIALPLNIPKLTSICPQVNEVNLS